MTRPVRPAHKPPRPARRASPRLRASQAAPSPQRGAAWRPKPKAPAMYLTCTLGRWQIELHQRAVYLTRHPAADPDCRSCKGVGGHGYLTEFGDADWEDCHCLTDFRTWTLRLWPRRNPAKEYPF